MKEYIKGYKIYVAYEDDWLLIVDKPTGLLVIPTPKNERHTLTNILNKALPPNAGPLLHPCHRLDRDTSGLIIYAKGKAVQQKMMSEFKNRKVKKAYIAVVQGKLPEQEGEMHSAIDGRSAVTRYKVIKKGEGFSVVEAQPVTGRKNQLRLHFKKLGNPILGEDRFAFRRDFKIKAKRLCLHARALEFDHPVSKEHIRVESEVPDRIKKFLEEK